MDDRNQDRHWSRIIGYALLAALMPRLLLEGIKVLCTVLGITRTLPPLQQTLGWTALSAVMGGYINRTIGGDMKNRTREINWKKIAVYIVIAALVPWVVVGGIKLGHKAVEFIQSLPPWQQAPAWTALLGMTGVVFGYLIYRLVRSFAIRKIHQAKDKPRILGVRLFGGGFIDVISKLSTDPELRFKAKCFAFVPRSIKGEAKISLDEEPLPVVEFPVREAIKTFEGAVAQRRSEEPQAMNEYMRWLNQAKGITCLVDITGKGKGHTGQSCLYAWSWLGKPDVARFNIMVFDLEKSDTGEATDEATRDQADDGEQESMGDEYIDNDTEKEVQHEMVGARR